MKKISPILLFAAFIFLAGLSLFSCTTGSNNDEEITVNGVQIPALLARKDTTLGNPSETTVIRQTYDKAIEAIKVNKDDPKAYINLATVYITEGRITGNGGYYSNAAAKVLEKVLSSDEATKDQRFQALSLKSTALLNMHQFKDALDVANQAVALNNFNAGIYGALVDANVELGHYDEAVKDCDKMISIRPDLRSYSRASYLRQIYGDNAGSIAAMQMAVQSGVPGEESTEWARVTLGDLYLLTGNKDSASLVYRIALVYRPNYPAAEMGMARVERANKNYDFAINHARNAIKVLSEAAYISAMADLYEEKGDTVKAAEVYNDVLKQLEDVEKNQPKNALIAHNGNRELGMAYLNVKQYDKALEYAKKDYDMRPDNIDANELMAWIYYNKGDYATAKMYADKTQVTHSMNPNSLYKNGMIYAKAGDVARGDSLKKMAMNMQPFYDQKMIIAAKQ